MSGLRLVASAALLGAAAATGAAGSNPVIELDLYAAMSQKDVNAARSLENMNMMSLQGVIKYIHTEVVVEHEVGPPERLKRKGDFESVARARFKVKNTPGVVADPGRPDTLVSDVDFGPYMYFQDGMATSDYQLGLIQRYGDMVGVQEPREQRYPTRDPYYMFSLSGYCPNQPFPKKANRTYLEVAESLLCSARSTDACLAKNDTCYWEWTGNWETSCKLHADLAAQCLNYTEASGHPGKVAGGLCPGGAGGDVTPTGEFGCAYSYGPLQTVNLDKLVGITEEDCGGRKCTNWQDFREHCSNPDYRWRYDGSSKAATPFTYCVEYDIHPACVASCTSKACLKLTDAQREIGLPFWRGRCNAQANQARAEKLAKALGLTGPGQSHSLVSKDLPEKFGSCVRKAHGTCAPTPNQGGMYCSRAWAGVCQPCYIPGTVETYGAFATTPTCPYDILSNPDYKGKFPSPKCKTSDPKDLCCIYTGTCVQELVDPAAVPLDDNGYALVAAKKSTPVMAAFLERAVRASGMARTMASLQDFAYWEWSANPTRGRTLQAVISDMALQGLVLPTTTTTKARTTQPNTTTAAASPVKDMAPVTAAGSQAGGFPWWGWALVVAGLAAAAGAATVAYFTMVGGKEKKVTKKRRTTRGAQLPAQPAGNEEYAAPLMAANAGTPAVPTLFARQQVPIVVSPAPVQVATYLIATPRTAYTPVPPSLGQLPDTLSPQPPV